MSEPALYAPQEPIFPRRVSGKFRQLKWWIMIFTLGIYYLTPWIRWDRGPSLPDQAVLVDMANRRFYFFWIEIWPHEFYFVAGLLIMAGLGLFLFTSALGRVWCGYTCPQTVWTDLFILVERWIEGDRNARVRLYRGKWDLHKWRLRLTKWTVWLAIAIATGGAWVFYFTDAPTLLNDLFTFSAHPVAYVTIAVLTATTFVFGGFMREQVCIYMCPWPRIQAAMMDPDTITVAYREWRGEPRGKGNVRRRAKAEAEAAAAAAQAAGPGAARYAGTPYPDRLRQVGGNMPAGADAGPGDCIDCMACVNVCPMGIDIRDGQQMECITCALCIDACDDVMDKIGKPRGLIGYLALSDEPAERAGEDPVPVWRHVLRPRTLLYTAAWLAIGLGLVYALFIRSDIELTVSPLRNPTYVLQSDGSVRNIYDVRLRNKAGEDRLFHMSLSSDEILRIELEGADRQLNVRVPANTTILQRVYVTARPDDPAATSATTDLRLWVEDADADIRASKATTFNGRDQ
ncbi:Cytochrome c oxidase accessory protein CcoG [Sulfitobacter noctilucicola]|uniref:Polyferredoxin n=1 Tax=Sulfitobacter noctilucicola TaxID=1342301 RepID=A0A7W6MAL4_9RHOB|nr:cytochrome c oxidase accessory protein CcoG [Sulfitobacter noctilucicola]KIN64191.1 Cytochrome c oxidase accessory protein CcoG [Sulfitobacter noctilucicola]MBB4175545.1 polyferredoxin [Sulfitobacter noctilucicola]